MQKDLIVFLNEYLKVIVAAFTVANRQRICWNREVIMHSEGKRKAMIPALP